MQCYPCHKEQARKWRASMGMLPTKHFPGVDIDAIHRNWPRRNSYCGATKEQE